MHLQFSSKDRNQLSNLSDRMRNYVNDHHVCRSEPIYKRNFISHLNQHYRRVPNNVGVISLSKNATCSMCRLHSRSACVMRTLCCGHAFHKRCIDNWLIDNKYRCYDCNKWQLT